MSQKLQLNAEMREGTGTSVAKKLRREGIVPGVIYGSGQRTYPVQVNERELSNLLKDAASENLLLDLVVEGAKEKTKLVLIQDVQHHTLNGSITHIDFQAVREDVEIKASLPVHLIGEAVGVKHGGVLDHQVHTLEVTCLPKDLPQLIEIDISEIGMNQALHVGEVSFPPGVTPTAGEQVVIAMVAEARTAADEEGEGATGEPVVTGGAAAHDAEDSDES